MDYKLVITYLRKTFLLRYIKSLGSRFVSYTKKTIVTFIDENVTMEKKIGKNRERVPRSILYLYRYMFLTISSGIRVPVIYYSNPFGGIHVYDL